jgi:hypothetical protein
MPGTYSAGEDGRISEREVIPANTGRISGIKEKILGAAFEGGRIFLRDGRRGNGIDDRRIYQESN